MSKRKVKSESDIGRVIAVFTSIVMGIVLNVIDMFVLSIAYRTLNDSLSKLLFPDQIVAHFILLGLSCLFIIMEIIFLIWEIVRYMDTKCVSVSFAWLFGIAATVMFISVCCFTVHAGCESEHHDGGESVPSAYTYASFDDAVDNDDWVRLNWTDYTTSEYVPLNYEVDYHKNSLRLITKCTEIKDQTVLYKYLGELKDFYVSLQSDAVAQTVDSKYYVITYPEHYNNSIDVMFVSGERVFVVSYSGGDATVGDVIELVKDF